MWDEEEQKELEEIVAILQQTQQTGRRRGR
jgi:hypothetical protein